MITFSVIVPVFMAEAYLEKCINSIINQTYQYFELILIDDASRDHSGEICDDYAARYKQISVIHEKENKGVSNVRNQGVANAKNDYIVFIDADDYVSDKYLELLAQTVEVGVDVCFCTKHISIKNGIEEVVSNGGNEESVLLRKSNELIEYFAYSNAQIPEAVMCNCYRKKFLIDNGIQFDTRFCVGEDIDFVFQAFFRLESARWLTIPCYYYNHDNVSSATNTMNSMKMNSLLSVHKKWFEYCMQKKEKVLYFKEYAKKFSEKANSYLLLGYAMSRKEKRKVSIYSIEWKKFFLYNNSILKKIVYRAYLLFGYENIIYLVYKCLNIKLKIEKRNKFESIT